MSNASTSSLNLPPAGSAPESPAAHADPSASAVDVAGAQADPAVPGEPAARAAVPVDADPAAAAAAAAAPTATQAAASAEPSRETEDRRVLLHMPVDVRSVALGVLAVLAGFYMVHWAAAVLIPIMLGVLVSYALSPLVDRLNRWHIPRAVGAGVLLSAIAAGIGGTAWSLSDDATQLAQSLPEAARKLQTVLAPQSASKGKDGPIDSVQRAAQQLEQAADSQGPRANVPRGVQRVIVERPRFNVKDYLWSGTVGLISFIGQTVIVVCIAFFLLASGDVFRRKLVKLAGPQLSKKKITVQALDEITAQIQRYLIVQVATSVIVGIATGLVFFALGLEQAIVWGVLAGVSNLIPYVGAVAVTAGASLVAFLQFGTLEMALAIAGASLVVHFIVGNLLTPWLTSRASRINPVVVFVGVLVWGWLWGLWGLLLGIPIIMVVKAICDRVDDLKPIGELLEG